MPPTPPLSAAAHGRTGLRVRLVLLALVPALAFLGLAGFEAYRLYDATRHADRVVELAGQLTVAVNTRNGVIREQTPTNVRLRAQGLGDVGPVAAGLLLGVDVVGGAAEGAAAADRGVVELRDVAPAMATARQELAAARQRAARAASESETDEVMRGYDGVERALDAATDVLISGVVDESRATGSSAALDARVASLEALLPAIESGDDELLALWAATRAPGVMDAAAEQELAVDAAALADGRARATALAGPAALALEPRVRSAEEPLATSVATILRGADDPQREAIGLVDGGRIFGLGLRRGQAYYDLGAASAADVQEAARDVADAARLRLRLALLAMLLVTLGSLALALVVARRITRPLGDLARQAQAVGSGDLRDPAPTSPHTPREVAVVRDAFAEMVAGLRALDAQAAALAERRLDDASLTTALPGPLGEHLHETVGALSRSIAEGERLRERLAYDASHDPLTRLVNRGAALDRLEAALARAGGDGVAVILVDLDGFKRTNDAFGHPVGDAVLVAAGERLAAAVRPGDVVARLGGDEFVAILEGVDGVDEAAAAARRLVAALAPPEAVGGIEVPVGGSAGVALGAAGVSAADLLREADVAAYRAKRRGRGTCDVFDEAMRAELVEHAELERALALAIRDDAIGFAYQPVVALADGAIVGVEALARWALPDGAPVAPGRFVAIAEESDLVLDLDRRALAAATAQLARWRASGGPLAGAAAFVNVSRRHVVSPGLVEDVQRALAGSGIPPAQLVLEVTEGVLIDDVLDLAAANLERVRALGVRVAIDDYGTGYTSLAHLGRLPADILKIDRTIVQAVDGTPDAPLVRLVADAARLLGLACIAEGVETAAQLAAARRSGCGCAQGFLLARPLAPDELERWAAARPGGDPARPLPRRPAPL